jgi:hypothetical protein
MVSVVRRFVADAFERVETDQDLVHRIAMAAHELLENAAKYSIGGRAHLRVAREPSGNGARAHLSLSNDTTRAHVARLRRLIEEIETSADPLEHYCAVMRKNAGVAAESGLGLARIRAEGELELGLEVEGTRITIMASTSHSRSAP